MRETGRALSRAGVAKPGYAREMIRMIEEHGPYVVIAPGLALAHARPSPEVLGDGIALVTLAAPVPFGHPHNDPVHVVIGLAIQSVSGHLDSIAALANLFNDSAAVDGLKAATTTAEVMRIFGEAE